MATDSEVSHNQYLREKNGYAANPLCSKCNGAGFIHPLGENGHPIYAEAVPCDEPDCLLDAKRHYQQTGKYLVTHGITSRLQTFEHFTKFGNVLASFNAFYALACGQMDKPFILCFGPTGNGKTHLCQALTTSLNRRGIVADYYTAPELMGMLKNAIADNSVEALVKTFSNLPALILDDFGSENYSEWGVAKLQEIIDNRWTERRITAMTMNKSLPELQLISPRIFSRMCDQEISQVVCNQGQDYRVAKR